MKKTRDRVKELIRVKASELRASASNWRLHGDQQKAAMRGILDEVGFVSGLIAFRDKRGKLTLIDGHLRKEISGDELVPVQVVDLTEAEAKKILATFDPIGAMATSNAEALESLLAGVKTDSEGVAAMLAELMAQANAAKPTPLVHEDEVPEPPKVAITKTGGMAVALLQLDAIALRQYPRKRDRTRAGELRAGLDRIQRRISSEANGEAATNDCEKAAAQGR
jgi:hypothetical protein